MNYYRREWQESRGDEYDKWGAAIYFLAVSSDSFVVAQIEIYQNGNALKYNETHLSDKYGGLSDQPIDEDDFLAFKIDGELFWQTWRNTHALNFMS